MLPLNLYFRLFDQLAFSLEILEAISYGQISLYIPQVHKSQNMPFDLVNATQVGVFSL